MVTWVQADTPQSQALHPSLFITAHRIGRQLTFPVLKVWGTEERGVIRVLWVHMPGEGRGWLQALY